jgi:hypothetical protein
MAWSNAKINLGRTVRRHSIDEDITVKQFNTPGMRMGGRWVDSSPITGAATASIQPAIGESLELLPQGTRTTDAIEVWGTSEMRPLRREEGKPADRIVWKGREYSAEVVEDWWQHGRYWFAVCAVVDQ